MTAKGYFCLVLHSHIPYTKNAGKWPFGEEWLYEAMAETYVPVLDVLADLSRRALHTTVCIGISPVLMEQLADPYMNGGFEDYLDRRIAAAKRDVARFALTCDHKFRRLAEDYVEYYEEIKDSYIRRWKRDLLDAFRSLQDSGCIEAITTAATHAHLPLISDERSIRMQLLVGRETHETYLGRAPAGIWLPECGYRPPARPDDRDSDAGESGCTSNDSSGAAGRGVDDSGADGGAIDDSGLVDSGLPGGGQAASGAVVKRGLEQYVEELGFKYFVVDSHAIEGGTPLGMYSAQFSDAYTHAEAHQSAGVTGKTTFRPYFVDGSSVVVFGRDRRTGSQVWSSEWGYPGDGSYREFHKRDDESGLRYWRVTSRLTGLDRKELYNPKQAMARVDEQSDHFVNLVGDLLSGFAATSDVPGILVAPYDIEFFGHWWHEGPKWLRLVLEKLQSAPEVAVVSPSSYLASFPPTESVRLKESSWGIGGKHYTWMNDSTEWLWDDLSRAEERLNSAVERCRGFLAGAGPVRRVMSQCVRELMLMQSSDWPFLITTGQAAAYARSRFNEHRDRFYRMISIAEAVAKGEDDGGNISDLEWIERIDSLFRGVNLARLLC
jgi:1,4-alpha-glucan branching enzyme